MAHLTLAGVSDDGKRLLLVDDAGVEFTLDVDARLRAALRGDHHRPGQLESNMESALRPRDIQARIRAGETPEAVAQAAQTSVDKIMAFAAPVLAEREHIAGRAQRSSVRRRDGGSPSGGARTLADAVAAHLRTLGGDPDTIEWDAWKRDDGRWTVVGLYDAGGRSGTAELTYDAPGNYVLLENDDARWLVGESVAAATSRDDLGQARQRRLSAVSDPGDELPLGDDALELVSEEPVEAFLDEAPATDPEVAQEQLELREEASDAAADEPEPEQKPEERPARRPVKKTRGRASVPSWDEIMFGGGKQE